MALRSSSSLKDETLANVSRRANVAQFVSFGPSMRVRHSALRSRGIDSAISSLTEAVDLLLLVSRASRVNVRTFHPEYSKSLPFHYDIRSRDDVVSIVSANADQGFYSIVNETIDVSDGGVSGVSLGGLVEFAPDDTPRCVEKPGTVALPTDVATQLLRVVYGVEIPSDPYRSEQSRVEFSVHPLRQGFMQEHVLCWEIEPIPDVSPLAEVTWPNRFSRKIGDKAFGLLVAHLFGLLVPRTSVLCRHMAPFTFGVETGTGEIWMRTCPAVAQPGRFSTTHGWTDPFQVMQAEDPTGEEISSVLSQEGIEARYSGAAIPSTRSGIAQVEGVAGEGEGFMLGSTAAEGLPTAIIADVQRLFRTATERLGPVRMEWVHDGSRIWVVQLHRTKNRLKAGVVSPGAADDWVAFNPSAGLDSLRELVEEVAGTRTGVLVMGGIGATSHVGDILRRARVPGRLVTESWGVQQNLF